MADEELDINEEKINDDEIIESHKVVVDDEYRYDPTTKTYNVTHLSGMFQSWFLDYASYVILERAVPHINDGLKPVQRRILHSMQRLDDGRYNKVANIIGHTMQFHPHGDASIGDALVQMGQKDLLIDCQGNWGNILTGDGAAAPRYIEARLTKFAQEVVFNPKTTQWKPSYDGRNKEPITLPVKFPLLLAMGVEGIAVGLASKILPHNFIELIEASIAHLQNEDFELYPDFQTGGYVDVIRYNDGLRGGAVRVRAKINKIDNKNLVITEIPFSKTTSSVIESIVKANDLGKIKIKKIDDNTAQNVEILIQLAPGVSPDITIDALYALTDCEISLSPNSCVIEDERPKFLGVKHMLRVSTDNTVELLRLELQIQVEELREAWQSLSLEKWFIENRIYKKKEYEEATSTDEAVEFIAKCIELAKLNLKREVTNDDILQLLEIKMKRILKFNSNKADDTLRDLEASIEEVLNHLQNIIPFAINYFKHILKKYGEGRERKCEIRNFDNISASKVVVANEKMYANFKEGFIGTSLRKDEFVCNCSNIDDIIIFKRDGKYLITKVSDKIFVGKDVIHIAVFDKNDDRTIYNVVYRDGRNGSIMIKRCPVLGLTRDKEYDLTKGTDNSKILYFTSNPNGEAEIIRVYLKPKPNLRKLVFEADFSQIGIKGRSSIGNILSKNDVHKIVLKEAGVSTLGGIDIWYDETIFRINSDERGTYLGEFLGDDKILVITKSGNYRTTNFDLSNHFEEDLWRIEKYEPGKIFSAIHFDGEQNSFYLKRFEIEPSDKPTSFIMESANSRLVDICDDNNPRVEVIFTGKHKDREPEIIDVAEFIAPKGVKARGKRVTTFETKSIHWIEPIVTEDEIDENPIDLDPDNSDDEPSKEVEFEISKPNEDENPAEETVEIEDEIAEEPANVGVITNISENTPVVGVVTNKSEEVKPVKQAKPIKEKAEKVVKENTSFVGDNTNKGWENTNKENVSPKVEEVVEKKEIIEKIVEPEPISANVGVITNISQDKQLVGDNTNKGEKKEKVVPEIEFEIVKPTDEDAYEFPEPKLKKSKKKPDEDSEIKQMTLF